VTHEWRRKQGTTVLIVEENFRPTRGSWTIGLVLFICALRLGVGTCPGRGNWCVAQCRHRHGDQQQAGSCRRLDAEWLAWASAMERCAGSGGGSSGHGLSERGCGDAAAVANGVARWVTGDRHARGRHTGVGESGEGATVATRRAEILGELTRAGLTCEPAQR
jgi:hypothetical protein